MNMKNIFNKSKFTPLKKIFEEYGCPKFKLGDNQVYYMGHGILLSYCENPFKIENNNRIEYGKMGEYLLALYFFNNRKELELNFKISGKKYEFDYDELNQSFKVINGIHIGDTFENVSRILRQVYSEYYTEGETRTLNDDKSDLIFQNKWIQRNNIELYFFGESEKTKLTAFKYIFTH